MAHSKRKYAAVEISHSHEAASTILKNEIHKVIQCISKHNAISETYKC